MFQQLFPLYCNCSHGYSIINQDMNIYKSKDKKRKQKVFYFKGFGLAL